MDRISTTRRPASAHQGGLTKAERIAQKALPGWKVVKAKPQSGPAAKPDAVAPPTWYLQYKAVGKPIPKSVHGVFQVGERFVAVDHGRLIQNGTFKLGKDSYIVEDSFVVMEGITKTGAVVSGGKVIGHQG